jgi:tetratricopeptide (TPR) repeat protein
MKREKNIEIIDIYIDREQVRVDDDKGTVHHFSEFFLERLEKTGTLSIEEQAKLGRNIYENIFTPSRKKQLEKILKQLSTGDNLALNIRSEDEGIHNIPFELINPEGSPDDFLLKRGNISVVRSIPTLGKTIKTSSGPVRILILLSLPLQTYRNNPFDVLKELKAISRPLYTYIQSGMVEVDIEEKVNIPHIREKVLKKKYDIVHFTGHGARGGRLIIEDEEHWEWEKEIEGKQIKDIFQNSGIKLFYFDACETAQAAEIQSSLAYHIYKNIPTASVIANLEVVEDRNATEATKYIYESLFDEQNFGSVLNRVRLKLHRDWWKPVVFGDPGQRLFDLDKEVTKKTKKKEKRMVIRGAEPSTHYVYRYGIVRLTSALIEEKNYLVLHGIGGAGKSTFANYLSEFYETRFKHILFFDLKHLDIKKPSELLDRILEELEMNELIADQEVEKFYSSKSSERVLNRQKADYIEKNLHDLYMKTLLILDNLEEIIQDERGIIKKEWHDLINFFLNSQTFFTIFTTRLRPYLTDRQPLDNLLEISEYTEAEFGFLYKDLKKEEKEYIERKYYELQIKCGNHPLSISKAIERKFDDLTKLFKLQEFKEIFEFYRPYFNRFRESTDVLFHMDYPFSDVFMENLFPADFIDLLKNKLLILKKIEDFYIYRPYTIIKSYFEKDFTLDFSNLSDLVQKTITLFKEKKYHIGDLFNIFFLTAEYYEKSKEKSIEPTLADIFAAIDFETFPQFTKTVLERVLSFINEFSLEGEKEGTLYHNLGKVYRKLGENENALKFFEKAEKIREMLDKDHISTAYTYSYISVIYGEQEKYQEESDYREKALKIVETRQGKNPEDIASIYNNIGEGYRKREEFSKALKSFEKAQKIIEDKPGIEHIIAKIYNNIGLVYGDQGEDDVALEYLKKALKIRESKLGINHVNTVATYVSITLTYRSLGKDLLGLKYCKKALEIAETKLGKEHPITANIYNCIGLIYNNLGQTAIASSCFNKALKINETKLGKEHTDTATIYNNIAELYYKQGSYIEALEYYKKAQKIFEAKLGKDHTHTAYTYNNIAEVYRMQGKYIKALEYYEKARKIVAEKRGENHPYMAATYNNIGLCHDALERYPEALGYYKKALRIVELKFENNHPDIATTCKNIALTYYAQRQYKDASNYFQRALNIYKNREDYETVLGIYLYLIYSSIQCGEDYTLTANYFCDFLELLYFYPDKDNQLASGIIFFFIKEKILSDHFVEKVREKIPYEVCKNNFDNFVNKIKAFSSAVPDQKEKAEQDKDV